mgnify:FL=1
MPQKDNNSNNQTDHKEVLEKNRTLKGRWAILITIIAISLSLFHLYTSGFGVLLALKQRAVHLLFIFPLTFLLYPFSRNKKDRNPTILDITFALLGLVPSIYILFNYKALALRAGAYKTTDIVLGAIIILLVLEGTRRAIGKPLPIIASTFLIFALFGPYMPGPLAHRGFSIERIISQLYLTTEGIFGIPIGVSATFVFMFVLLGAFLEATGVSQYLLDLAFAGMGHRRGGPAKAAVVSSGLMGMVSGSSIANTVTTGSITIPIMKKVGFKPEVAGAVEASASTNGQFMPPIMGAAAFIMVEFTEIAYVEIIKHAIIPAILCYIGLLCIIHIQALKTGIEGMDKSELDPFWSTFFKGIYYIFPILVLLYFLIIIRVTPLNAAFWAIVTCIAVTIGVKIFKVSTTNNNQQNEDNSKQNITPKQALKEFSGEMIYALKTGAKNMVNIALACACAGIIIGIVNLTGLGLRMTSLIVTLAQGKLLLTLLFAMIASIILGFGLPTTATYIVMATLTAPAVAQLGVPLIAAHLFVFYYGIVADVTPPVCLATYAGAGIANSDPVKTGILGVKFDLVAFVLPFIFVYSPNLLLIDTTIVQIIVTFITALIGMYAFSAAIQNFYIIKTTLIERIILFAVAVMLIIPNFIYSIIGIVGFGVVTVFQRQRNNGPDISQAA